MSAAHSSTPRYQTWGNTPAPGRGGRAEGLDGRRTRNGSDLGDGDREQPPHSCFPQMPPPLKAGQCPGTQQGVLRMCRDAPGGQRGAPRRGLRRGQQGVQASALQTEAQTWAVAGILSWPPHSEAGWEVFGGPTGPSVRGGAPCSHPSFPVWSQTLTGAANLVWVGLGPMGARRAAEFFGGMGGEEAVGGRVLWGPQARQTVEEPLCPLTLL